MMEQMKNSKVRPLNLKLLPLQSFWKRGNEERKKKNVLYKDLECSCYDYLPCFNVNVTALLVLPPFYFRMFEIIPF